MSINDQLPDFDDMATLASASSRARYESLRIKNQLEEFIAGCVRICYTDQHYWPGGKSPTQSYIEKVVKVVGNTPEDATRIRELTEQYQLLHKEYEEAKQLLKILEDKISVFQTLSANQRSGM